MCVRMHVCVYMCVCVRVCVLAGVLFSDLSFILTSSYSYAGRMECYRLRRNDMSWVTVDDEKNFENLVKLVEVATHIAFLISNFATSISSYVN